MNGYIITIWKDEYSTKMSKMVEKSAREFVTNLDVVAWRATTPDECCDFDYTYPLEGQTTKYDGMDLIGYKAKDFRKKVACSISHLRLWDLCYQRDVPIVILEHDVVFTRKFDAYKLSRKLDDGDILMLNDPRGATRKGQKYHENILSKGFGVHPVDGVNSERENVPDGLAGNSAYIITPKAAKKASDLQNKIGIWPNDALLCKQLFGDNLKSVYPYKTTVNQLKSTTTG